MNLTKKALIALVTIGMTTFLSASDIESNIYSNGVRDAFSVGERYFMDKSLLTGEKKKKIIRGYLTYVVANNMNEADIIRVTSVGIKNGYQVEYLRLDSDDIISFGLNERKPDANYIQERLAKFNIVSKILNVNVEVHYIDLVGKRLIQIIKRNIDDLTKTSKERINTLEEYIRKIAKNDDKDFFADIEKDAQLQNAFLKPSEPKIDTNTPRKIQECEPLLVEKPCDCKQQASTQTVNQIIDVSNLQVINRVVTKNYLNKYAKGDVKKIEPLNANAKKTMTIEEVDSQIQIVGKNIKEDVLRKKKIPSDLNSLNSFYKYVRAHGAINSKNQLILNGSAYKVGEDITEKYRLEKVMYETGVIVVADRYLSGITKKED